MLRGPIEQVNIRGVQQCYNQALSILDKTFTYVQKDNELTEETFRLANDVNHYFTRIVRFERINLYTRVNKQPFLPMERPTIWRICHKSI